MRKKLFKSPGAGFILVVLATTDDSQLLGDSIFAVTSWSMVFTSVRQIHSPQHRPSRHDIHLLGWLKESLEGEQIQHSMGSLMAEVHCSHHYAKEQVIILHHLQLNHRQLLWSCRCESYTERLVRNIKRK